MFVWAWLFLVYTFYPCAICLVNAKCCTVCFIYFCVIQKLLRAIYHNMLAWMYKRTPVKVSRTEDSALKQDFSQPCSYLSASKEKGTFVKNFNIWKFVNLPLLSMCQIIVNKFGFHSQDDCIFLVSTEPSMRWHTSCAIIIPVVKHIGIICVEYLLNF